MKYQSQVRVLGMKFSKGTLDNGTAYDSTKVYAEVAMDTSKANAVGTAAGEFAMGDSTEFQKYKHLPFPFDGVGDFEIVTNGKTAKTVLHSIKPIEPVKPLAGSKVS